MTANLDPKQIAKNVDAKSDDLIAEFEKHYAELIESNPEHEGQRDLAFQGWIIQKVASLQLCITELESRLAETKAE